ncbi:Hsp20/alpha crystallin family protein [Paenibacillus allorhizosphaerae]
MNKLKEWMDFANQCNNGGFWENFMDERALVSTSRTPESPWTPLADMVQTGDATLLIVELPGVRREELDLTITGDSLLIKGVKNHRVRIEEFLLCERHVGAFERAIRLPYPVEAGAVSAKMAEGLLFVRLPLPSSKQSKISIE